MNKQTALDKIKELQAFIEQLDSEERWKPEMEEKWWYLEGVDIDSDLWETATLYFGNEYYDLGNCFRTRQEVVFHKLRLQSMAERGREPKEDEEIWYWDFRGDGEARIWNYIKTIYADYLIGNIHKTKEDCEAWYAKYGEAFEVLGKGEE